MRLISKLSIIIIFLSGLVLINPILALDIQDRNEYLIDVRGDDGDIYLNRLSAHKKLESYDMEISGFGEMQWNLETDEWEKLMLGMDVGKFFWKYLYIGQSIQVISGEILDHIVFDANSSSLDTTTKIRLHLPLVKKTSLNVFEEYSINLEKGRDGYCETGAEIVYNLKDLSSIAIGWRHTDRIHNFDTDYVSLSFTLRF